MLTNSSLALLFTALMGPLVADQMHRSAVTLSLLRKTPRGGANATWAVSGGSNDSKTYADGEDIEDGSSDTRVKAVQQWGIYGGPVAVGDLASAIAQSTLAGLAPASLTGPYALFQEEVRIRTEKTAELINKHILTGTGTMNSKPALVGLDSIGKATGTYAGLDPDTYDWWKGIEDTAESNRLITVELVQGFLSKFMKKDTGRGKKPTHAVLEPDLWGALKKDIEKNKKMQVTLYQQVAVGGETITLPAGSSAFSIDGVMFVQEPDAPTDRCFFFCVDEVELLTLPPASQLQPGVNLESMIRELMGNVPVDLKNFGVAPQPLGRLMPYVEFLAKTGLGQRAFVGVNVALAARSRKSVGTLRALKAA